MLVKLKDLLTHMILGLIYFLILTPIGFVLRIFGRDTLRLKPYYGDSFWIEVDSNKIDSKSFKKQY